MYPIFSYLNLMWNIILKSWVYGAANSAWFCASVIRRRNIDSCLWVIIYVLYLTVTVS